MKMVVQRKETLKLRHVVCGQQTLLIDHVSFRALFAQILMGGHAPIVVGERMCRVRLRGQSAMKLSCPMSWKTQGGDHNR